MLLGVWSSRTLYQTVMWHWRWGPACVKLMLSVVVLPCQNRSFTSIGMIVGLARTFLRQYRSLAIFQPLRKSYVVNSKVNRMPDSDKNALLNGANKQMRNSHRSAKNSTRCVTSTPFVRFSHVTA